MGYVLVGLGFIGILGIAFGLVLRSSNRIGFQVVGLPVDYNRSESHLEFVLFDLDNTSGYLRALRNHGFPFYLNRSVESRGRGVTGLVLICGDRLADCRLD